MEREGARLHSRVPTRTIRTRSRVTTFGRFGATPRVVEKVFQDFCETSPFPVKVRNHSAFFWRTCIARSVKSWYVNYQQVGKPGAVSRECTCRMKLAWAESSSTHPNHIMSSPSLAERRTEQLNPTHPRIRPTNLPDRRTSIRQDGVSDFPWRRYWQGICQPDATSIALPRSNCRIVPVR